MSQTRRSIRLWVPVAAVAALAIIGRWRRRTRRAGDGGVTTPGAADLRVTVAEADRIEQHQPSIRNRLEPPDLAAEASEGDLIEQGQPVAPDAESPVTTTDLEAPEADALEQATSAGDDDDRR